MDDALLFQMQQSGDDLGKVFGRQIFWHPARMVAANFAMQIVAREGGEGEDDALLIAGDVGGGQEVRRRLQIVVRDGHCAIVGQGNWQLVLGHKDSFI